MRESLRYAVAETGEATRPRSRGIVSESRGRIPRRRRLVRLVRSATAWRGEGAGLGEVAVWVVLGAAVGVREG